MIPDNIASGPDLIPANDAQRLAALHRYQIIYSDPEEVFDNITRIMAVVFDMPMAFISLVDKEQVFYKAKVGPFNLPQVDRNDSLCSIAILQPQPTIFTNTLDVPYLTEGRFIKGEGGLRFYAGAPLTTPEGLRIGTVCVCDTTPRNFTTEQTLLLERFAQLVQHEIEIRLAARAQGVELEAMVAARTAELQRANEALQKTNAELEQFAYVSSHDLQEPLRKIRIYSSLIAENEGLNWSERTQEAHRKIMESTERMSGSLKDLLHFAGLSKAESFELVDLNEVLVAVTSDLELQIRQQNARINAATLPTLPAIPLQMHQLFYNLLNNALKYRRPNTTPEIAIQVKEVEDGNTGNKGFEITIADNGIGFDMQYHDKIFTIFQRLHNRTEYSGNGIGLALCRKVVQNHSGNIYATSIPGQGTCFHVVLPNTSARMATAVPEMAAI
ncbi:GAF domain-containing protein [Cnuella takakiae]|uniref:histidine kinase n=1 Tax=Cnuella takakiae TaxID=1302690 RepID=A0A1M5B5Q5_9BACT|nr:ATP-binding protein [Cnuella takakiae]SHF37770.1 GAF domain-containing protein [Cnuella takakiae]